MPLKWVERHARGASTNSRTLPPIAFPSLPLDQQNRAAPTHPPRENSGVDLTESDREKDPPTSTDSDDANVISGVSWKAIKYHIDQYPPSKNPVEESVLADRQRLFNSGVLPKPKNPSSLKTRPRSVNYEHLQAKHTELTNKRKALEIKLRLLGYSDRRLEASIRKSAAGNQPQKPSIDSLWRTVQDLKWLTHKLELIESHARCAAKARKKFFSRLSNFKENAEISFASRPGAYETCPHYIGWRNDPDWHAMHATARKLLAADEEPQKQPHSMANWPRPYYMPFTDVPAKTPDPSSVDHRRRPHSWAIGGTRAAPILLDAVAEEVTRL